MTDDQIREWMQRADTDRDGRISAAEAANSQGGLRDGFAQYDLNQDGFIDVPEYRVYATARFANRGQPQVPGGMPPGGMPMFPPAPGQPQPAAPGQPGGEEPTRPEVMRYGKLPKGAPTGTARSGCTSGGGRAARRPASSWRRTSTATAT